MAEQDRRKKRRKVKHREQSKNYQNISGRKVKQNTLLTASAFLQRKQKQERPVFRRGRDKVNGVKGLCEQLMCRKVGSLCLCDGFTLAGYKTYMYGLSLQQV